MADSLYDYWTKPGLQGTFPTAGTQQGYVHPAAVQPVDEQKLLAEWKARFDAQGNITDTSGMPWLGNTTPPTPPAGNVEGLIKLQNAANLTGVQPAAMQTATGSAALTPPAVPNVKQPLVKSEPKRVAFAPGDTSSYPPPAWDPWREPRSGSQQAIDLWDNRYEQWRNQGGGGSPADTSVTNYVGAKASPEGYKYYGPTGKAYAGDETSYWLNAAENQWYMGNKATNQITAIPKPPFDAEAVPNPPPVDPKDPISNTTPGNDLGMPAGWDVPPTWWVQAGRSAAEWMATMRSAYGGGGGTTNTPSPSGTNSTGGYVPGKMIADYAASQQGNQAKSWLSGLGYGQHEGGLGHPQYYNAAGRPYIEGVDTTAYWPNAADRTWYTGEIPSEKITATTQLPWMVQPYASPQGNNYTYFGPTGSPMTSGDKEAYWKNTAENVWYHGTLDGKIEKKNPPWM